jgi:hypothetical protein
VKFEVLDSCRGNDDSIIDVKNKYSNNLNLASIILTVIIFTQKITIYLNNCGRKILVNKNELQCRN